MILDDIREPWGPKASWHLSLKVRKNPEKTSPWKLVPTKDRTRVHCVTSPQGLNISSIRIFDQIRDLEMPITLRPHIHYKGTQFLVVVNLSHFHYVLVSSYLYLVYIQILKTNFGFSLWGERRGWSIFEGSEYTVIILGTSVILSTRNS